MRIIAGNLGGRRIASPCGRAVRPAGERLRESVFSALGDVCREARVADMFAGSGAFGFEALSRGAAHVTFVEKHRATARQLDCSARELGVRQHCRIVCADVAGFLGKLERSDFDLLFADPPFTAGAVVDKLLAWWRDKAVAQSVLVLKYSAGEPPQTQEPVYRLLKTALFGESGYAVFLHE